MNHTTRFFFFVSCLILFSNLEISARVPIGYVKGELPVTALQHISPIFLTFIHASGKPVPVTYALVTTLAIAEQQTKKRLEEELYDLHWHAWTQQNDSKKAYSSFIAKEAQKQFDTWFTTHKRN